MDGNTFLSGGYEPFLAHFEKEHRDLGKEVQGVREMFDHRPTPADAVVRLKRLREKLVEHFEDEECGCFDEMVARYPHLATEAKHIEQQHPALLEMIDQMIATARDRPDPTELTEAYTTFREKLCAHEKRENELIREGLNLSGEA